MKADTNRRVSLAGRTRHVVRKFIAHGRVRILLQFLFAKLQAALIQPTILPYFVTFFPYRKSSYSYKLPKRASQKNSRNSELPTPPERLWMGYGLTIDEWLSSGKEHVATMRGVLAESGYSFEEGHRILELGCAAGRMTRWLNDVADKCEIWGTDIDGEHIFWCKQHLSPPFNFFLTTTYPHLPFEDRYFDVIYAGSVFTHIDDLADAWLLELRRIAEVRVSEPPPPRQPAKKALPVGQPSTANAKSRTSHPQTPEPTPAPPAPSTAPASAPASPPAWGDPGGEARDDYGDEEDNRDD